MPQFICICHIAPLKQKSKKRDQFPLHCMSAPTTAQTGRVAYIIILSTPSHATRRRNSNFLSPEKILSINSGFITNNIIAI